MKRSRTRDLQSGLRHLLLYPFILLPPFKLLCRVLLRELFFCKVLVFTHGCACSPSVCDRYGEAVSQNASDKPIRSLPLLWRRAAGILPQQLSSASPPFLLFRTTINSAADSARGPSLWAVAVCAPSKGDRLWLGHGWPRAQSSEHRRKLG
jgi:hypothetical protein